MKELEMVNKRYGKLVVVSKNGTTPAGHTTWNCLCDCGNIVVRTGTSIRRSKNSSCGCYSIYGANSPCWKGVGEISAAWFDAKVRRAADGSKGGRKIKEVNVSLEYLWDLFLEQDRKCIYSGIILTFPKLSTSQSISKSTASLDRIDSDKGYIEGNVQWVHKHINIMKNAYSQEHFINMCKLVAENNG